MVGKNTTLGDSDATEEFVELLIVAYGQLNGVGGTMRVFLLSRAALPAELKDLSSEVLKDGGQ
ncbi:unnamed protein product, partial [Sphagnum compactum]